MNLIEKAITGIFASPLINKPIVYLWHLYHIAQLNKVKNQSIKTVYKVIEKDKLDITSDFSFYDVKALEGVVQLAIRERMTIAEIGSWKGMSTAVLAQTVKPFNGVVFAIDHWQGSIGVPEHKQAETRDMLSNFRHNMKALGLLDIVHPMIMDSKTAAGMFKDNYLDMVFIDADHSYSHIKEDIEMWLPKLKPNGIIAGHDCEEKYTKFGEYIKTINEHLEEDAIIGACHPGVVKALYDVLRDDYNIVPDSTIWWRRK